MIYRLPCWVTVEGLATAAGEWYAPSVRAGSVLTGQPAPLCVWSVPAARLLGIHLQCKSGTATNTYHCLLPHLRACMHVPLCTQDLGPRHHRLEALPVRFSSWRVRHLSALSPERESFPPSRLGFQTQHDGRVHARPSGVPRAPQTPEPRAPTPLPPKPRPP